MSFLNTLVAARKAPADALSRFLLRRDGGETFFVFVEGQDDPQFYRFLCRLTVGRIPETIVCGNKKGVYHATSVIEPRRRQNDDVLYFVDKDLDDLVPSSYPVLPALHVLSRYSIENYFATADAFRILWDDCLRFNGKHKIDFEPLDDHHGRGYQTFQTMLLPTVAWIVAARRNGYAPILSNIRLDRFFYIDQALNPVSCPEQPDLKQVCGVDAALPHDFEEQVSRTIKELSAKPPETYIPGKFQLWFTLAFFNAVAEKIRKERPGVKLSQLSEREARALLIQVVPGENDITSFIGRKVNR